MDIQYVQTENAKKEQWRLLSQFLYPRNILEFFRSKGREAPESSTVEYITGCFSQAKAYYDAASGSPLSISPLLFYYGSSLLLSGAAALISGEKLPINEHGMRIGIPAPPEIRVAELSIKPVNTTTGALQLFANVYSNADAMVNGESWDLLEILGSIPDLKGDFEQCYPDAKPFSLPVEIVKTHKGVFERMSLSECSRYENPEKAINAIVDYKKSYLDPQIKKEYAIFRRRVEGTEIGSRSIFGRKFLFIGHPKAGLLLNPDQLIMMFMGLHALGFVSRYHPELWNQFVNNDQTGERLLIEKFLIVCERYCPNLILEKLTNVKLQFVYKLHEDTVLDEARG